MKINPLFSSFLMHEKLDLPHEEVVNWCLENNNNTDFIQEATKIYHPDGIIKNVWDEVEKQFNILHKEIGLSSKYKQKIDFGWINTKEQRRFLEPHNHPEATFVAVYYPLIEGDAPTISFESPFNDAQYVFHEKMIDTHNIFNSNIWNFEPTTGDLLIFPGWLKHFVGANSDKECKRISIAINSTTILT